MGKSAHEHRHRTGRLHLGHHTTYTKCSGDNLGEVWGPGPVISAWEAPPSLLRAWGPSSQGEQRHEWQMRPSWRCRRRRTDGEKTLEEKEKTWWRDLRWRRYAIGRFTETAVSVLLSRHRPWPPAEEEAPATASTSSGLCSSSGGGSNPRERGEEACIGRAEGAGRPVARERCTDDGGDPDLLL